MRLVTGKPLARTSSPYLILAVICLGIFVAALDQTVIYGALPDMMTDIRLPITKLDQAAWIVIGYLLGYTFAMPLMGGVSDVYGHGRIYILSLLIFMAGSVLVALATSLPWMVSARVIQAIGGGAVVPIAMAIAGDVFTGRSRAVALGIIGGAVEAGGALGPLYGAAVAQLWGWQWIFWINLPVSILVIAVILRFLGASSQARGKIDYLGGFLLAAVLAFLSLGLSQQSEQSHFLAYLLGFLLASLLFFSLFVWRETGTANPLVKPAMFRSATFSMANLTNLLVGGSLIVAMVNIPLMTDTIMGRSPVEGGLRLLRFTVMLSAGAVIGGFWCKRFGYRLPTVLGLILSSLGFFLMSRWSLVIADPSLTLHLAVGGLGFGLVVAPLSTAVIDSVSAEQRGIASSLVIVMRMMGMIIGLSAITSWGMGRFHLMTADMSLAEIMAAPQQLTDSLLTLFHNFFQAAAVICLVAILPALWLGRRKEPPAMTGND